MKSPLPICFPFIVCVLFPAPLLSTGATYSVGMNGSDLNPGTEQRPWQTIQKAANTMVAGDTVVVRSGMYDERVSSVRGGTSETSRISFVAEDTVTMKGWDIAHPHVTVAGFDITGWSSPNRNTAQVDITSGGDNVELLNCTVRDGVQITRADMVFHAVSNTISSAIGGFLIAGFRPGQTLYVGAATNGLTIANSGVYTIADVTETSVTVSSPLVDDGPLCIYLSASYEYGLNLHPGSTNCVIRGCTFSNLGYDTWFIMGNGHLLESNTITRANGWDVMHFGGSNHVFRRNLIQDCPLVVYQVSPDAMENYPSSPYSNVTFISNFIYGFAGVMASQKGENTSDGLTLTHNVFVDVGRLTLTHPGTTFENNTLLRVSRVSSPVVSRASHPLLVLAYVGATNTTLLNNIFVDCGKPSGIQTEADVGWYEVSGSTDSVWATGNFAAGSAPAYGAKASFDEGNPLLNGGDPGFVNIDDPLGPDGIPFTEDDGLRLRADSKLREAGYGAVDLGAYNTAAPRPTLRIDRSTDGMPRIAWSVLFPGFTLQSSPAVTGTWEDLSIAPVVEGHMSIVTDPLSDPSRFYRLVK